MAETQVEKLMRLLDCTQEEALDVIEKDKIIDRGGRTEFDLDKERLFQGYFGNRGSKGKFCYC